MQSQGLNVFDFEDHAVRVIDQKGNPWFVGKDVCRCLEISDHHQALERLDEDEGGRYNIPTTSGPRETKMISEPGLYRLIFTSRTEAAERFKRWIAHEVLPAIRQTGTYTSPADDDENVVYDAPSVAASPDDMELRRQWVSEINLCMRTMGRRYARQMWRSSPLWQPEEDDADQTMPVPTYMEPVLRFMTSHAVHTPGKAIGCSALRGAYERWCAENEIGPINASQFGKALAALGYRRMRGTREDGSRTWDVVDTSLKAPPLSVVQ